MIERKDSQRSCTLVEEPLELGFGAGEREASDASPGGKKHPRRRRER